MDKIKKLTKIICRSPWALSSAMINDILDETWTLSNLTSILQFIAFVSEMSCISLAVGLIPEEKTLIDDKISKILEIKREYDE